MREYDESDAKVRPNPRGSRPRSKQRPTHDDARPGIVVGVDRGRIRVLVGGDPGGGAGERDLITAVKARELGRRAVVVGDWVAVVGDTTGDDGTLARIVRREERRNALRRSADDTDPTERVIVANQDQLAIVAALADPEPNSRMIDRCLVAAFHEGMTPLLVLTKADIAPAGLAAELRAAYEPLGVTVIETRTLEDADGAPDPGVERVRQELHGLATVMVGPSGVGKSTLVNHLVPGAYRTTGGVNLVTGRGRHTSTSVVALEVPTGGWIVDTPGVRSFGLAHVTVENLLLALPDLGEAAERLCPRGCAHLDAADGCALDAWAAEGGANAGERAERVDSVRRLLASRASGADG